MVARREAAREALEVAVRGGQVKHLDGWRPRLPRSAEVPPIFQLRKPLVLDVWAHEGELLAGLPPGTCVVPRVELAPFDVCVRKFQIRVGPERDRILCVCTYKSCCFDYLFVSDVDPLLITLECEASFSSSKRQPFVVRNIREICSFWPKTNGRV